SSTLSLHDALPISRPSHRLRRRLPGPSDGRRSRAARPHVSMLTAFPPEVHGILWDEYAPLRGRLSVPSVFTAVRAAGMRSAMVVGKNKFDYFRDTGVVDEYVLAAGGDDEVAARAARATQSGFNLVFAHLPDVDLSGHARNWMSPGYLERVVRANNHGRDAACDMTIPWIAS